MGILTPRSLLILTASRSYDLVTTIAPFRVDDMFAGTIPHRRRLPKGVLSFSPPQMGTHTSCESRFTHAVDLGPASEPTAG